jgi:hypothetical protein
MTNIYRQIGLSFLCALFFAACGEDATVRRLRNSIQVWEREKYSAVLTTTNKANILAALRSVTVEQLHHPVPASAILAKNPDGLFHLYFSWVEDQPRGDHFELRYSRGASPLSGAFLEWDLRKNSSDATTGVVFTGRFVWPKNANEAKDLDRVVSSKELVVRMLRGAEPVTSWVPVQLFHTNTFMP